MQEQEYPTYFTGGGPMEPGGDYYYPAGTPAPETEHTTMECSQGHRFRGAIIRDLGTADLDPSACPECGDEDIRRARRRP